MFVLTLAHTHTHTHTHWHPRPFLRIVFVITFNTHAISTFSLQFAVRSWIGGPCHKDKRHANVYNTVQIKCKHRVTC